MKRRPKPDPEELRSIVEELKGELDDRNHEVLENFVTVYAEVIDLLRDDDMTIERLRTFVKTTVRNDRGNTSR